MVLYGKRSFRKSFTLVELIVSMAVFSLLLVMVMNFFGGAQKLVSGNGQNNDMYADARAAMDLMASMIGSTYYATDVNYAISKKDGGIDVREHSEGGTDNKSADTGFLFERDEQTNSKKEEPAYDLFFAVKPDLNNDFFRKGTSAGNDIRNVFFVRICRGADTSDTKKGIWNHKYRLYINYINPQVGEYDKLFPPYTDISGDGSWDTIRKALMDILRGSNSNVVAQEIIRNVVGLEFIFYKKLTEAKNGYYGTAPIEKIISDTSEQKKEYKRTPPYMVEIKLSLLTAEQMKEFCDISDSTEQETYLQLHRRTFSRLVYVGEHGLDAAKVQVGGE